MNALRRLWAWLGFGVQAPGAVDPNETRARDNIFPDYRDADLRAQARRRALEQLNDNANDKRKR